MEYAKHKKIADQVWRYLHDNPIVSPFDHAELVPISRLARFLGINPGDFVLALKRAGFKVNSAEQSLKKELGQVNGVSPAILFDAAMTGLRKRRARKWRAF